MVAENLSSAQATENNMDKSVMDLVNSDEVQNHTKTVEEIEQAVIEDIKSFGEELNNPSFDGNFFMLAIQRPKSSKKED